MRLRGPCCIVVRPLSDDWVSRLAVKGAFRSLRERLPDAKFDRGHSADGPWDLDLTVSGHADDPLALLAGNGVPDAVLKKRRGMAEIVGWVPSGKARPTILTMVGLDERWVEGFADPAAAAGSRVVHVDGSEQPGVSALPEWASDADRAATCSTADLAVIGPAQLGAAAFARSQVIFCGRAEHFPAWIPRDLIAGTPSELLDLADRAFSSSLPPFVPVVDLEDRLDELAKSAAEAGFARSPEEYRRWAAVTADLADATGAELETVRDFRRGDRAILGETAHRLGYAEEQYRHCDYARLQAEEELSRLRRSPSVRLADRLARLMRA